MLYTEHPLTPQTPHDGANDDSEPTTSTEREDAWARAWVIAERLARAGGARTRLAGTDSGYRIELHLTGPTSNELEVVKVIGLGDRWGHRYSSPARNDGVAKHCVWSEVHRKRAEPEESPLMSHRLPGDGIDEIDGA
ncbi:hypothetical protein [Kitasatospora cineracea]|uniref:hypothetical protein n=1 Tax=Kitasatospora cineracea TaxID=88074 RepID=UPI0037F67786